MAAPAAVLTIVVQAQTKAAQAQLAKLQGELKASGLAAESSAAKTAAATSTMAKRMESAATTAKKAGRSLTTHVSLPIVAVGALAGKMALDFEDSMNQIQNLVGASNKQIRDWSQEIFRLGPKLGKSPQELAKALYFVTSSGIKASEAMRVVEEAAKGSAVGLGTTQVVADALTSAMNAYADSNLNAKDATNVLANTVKFGKLEADSLAGTIGKVIPISSRLGVSFNDVGASLAALSLQGLDAAESTTALRGIFTAALKPSADSEKALKSVGLSAAALRTELKDKGTLATLQDLSDRFKGNSDQIARVFPNVRALVGAFSLMGGNAKQTGRIFDELNKNVDTTGKGFARLQKTPGQKLNRAVAELQTAMTKLGITLLPKIVPILTEVGKQVGKVVGWFTKLPAATQGWIIKVGLLAVALGPVLHFFSFFVSGAGKIVSGIMAIGRAMSATAAATGEAAAATDALAASQKATMVTGGGGMMGVSTTKATTVATSAEKAGASSGRIFARGLAGSLGIGAVIAGGFEALTTQGGVLDTIQGKGSQIGKTISDAIGSAFDAQLGPRVAHAFRGKNIGKLQAFSGALRSAISQAAAAGASAADLKPLQDRLAKLGRGIGSIKAPRIDFGNSIKALRGGLIVGMTDINKVLHKGLAAADKGWVKGTSQWRSHVAMAMRAASDAVLKGMQRSGKVTKEGLARMQSLLHGADLISPTRKWAKQFGEAQVNAWANGRKITAKGVQHVLDEIRKENPAAQKITVTGMLNRLDVRKKEGDLSAKQYRTLRSKIKTEFTGMNITTQKQTAAMMLTTVKNVTALVSGATAGYSLLGKNTNKALKAFNVKPILIGLKTVGNLLGFQRGGEIVPGSGDGDKVPRMLPVGSFVMNKKATKAYGFRRGGMMPTVLEPGERTFMPHEVKSIGPRNLEAMNQTVSRFAKGGKVTEKKGGKVPREVLTGGLPTLRGAAQRGLDKVHTAANAYVQKHRPKPKAGLVSGSSGSVIKDFADVLRHYRAPYIPSVALYMAGLDESGLRDLGYGDSTSQGPLQLLSSTAAGLGVSPHDVKGVASLFLTRGFYGKGGALSLYRSGVTDPATIDTMVQGNAAGASVYVPFQSQAASIVKSQGLHYRPNGTMRLQRGGWAKVGSTIDPTQGQAGAGFSDHGGMSFAELLVAGANAGLKHKALYRTLGIRQEHSYPYGMPMEHPIMVRKGDRGPFKIWKNDVGSGQTGDPYYKIDLHSKIAHKLRAGGKDSVQVSTLHDFNQRLRGRTPQDAGSGKVGRRGGPPAGATASSSGSNGPPGWHSTSPRTLNRAYAIANYVNAKHLPYNLGGGHTNPASLPSSGIDCSAATSYLVQQMGYNNATAVSGGQESWGQSGKGEVALLATANHVHAVIGGKAWGTSSSDNPGGGPGWISSYAYDSHDSHGVPFVVRHMPLSQGGGGSGGGSTAGPTPAQKRAAAKASRLKQRNSQADKLRQQVHGANSAGAKLDLYWQLMKLYAQWGDWSHQKTKKGHPGSAGHKFLDTVREAAKSVNPNAAVGKLHRESTALKGIDLVGAASLKPKDSLLDEYKRAIKIGKRAEKKQQKRLFHKVSTAGLDPKQRKQMSDAQGKVLDLQELIGVAETNASGEWGPGGSEMTNAERDAQVALNTSMLKTLFRERNLIYGIRNHLRDHLEKLKKQIEEAQPKDSKSHFLLGSYKSNRTKSKATLGDLKTALEDVQGRTGQAGAIFDTQVKLKDLGATTTTEGVAASTRADLLAEQLLTARQQLAVSQAQYKVLSNLPPFGGSFAKGGVVPGPTGAPRMVVAHGGEHYQGVGQHATASVVEKEVIVQVQITDKRTRAWVDQQEVRAIIRDETTKSIRAGSRGLPGRGGGG